MKEYLSIGEVSKLKGVSIKSLRYYGELGILPPAYINKKTGYRYYSMDQMVVVDLIITCLDFDIPLKNFHNYILDNGILDIDRLLSDGKKIAEIKFQKLKTTLKMLDNISNHLNVTAVIKKNKGTYLRKFSKRFFLTTKWNGDIYDDKEFMSKLSQLYKMSNEFNLTINYNQGVLFSYKNNKATGKTFIEIEPCDSDVENILVVPEGDFLCKVYYKQELSLGEQKYINDRVYPNGSILIVRELYDKKTDQHPTPVEFQLFIKK